MLGVWKKVSACMGLAWRCMLKFVIWEPSLCFLFIHLHKAIGKRVVYKLHLRNSNQCNVRPAGIDFVHGLQVMYNGTRARRHGAWA